MAVEYLLEVEQALDHPVMNFLEHIITLIDGSSAVCSILFHTRAVVASASATVNRLP